MITRSMCKLMLEGKQLELEHAEMRRKKATAKSKKFTSNKVNKRQRSSKNRIEKTEQPATHCADAREKYVDDHANKREMVLHWLEQLQTHNIDNKVDNTDFDTQASSSYTSDLLEELNLGRGSGCRRSNDVECLRCRHFLDVPRNLLESPCKRLPSLLAQCNADLSFIQAISWLKSAILTMSSISREEYYLIFHRQWANTDTESTRKKVRSIYERFMDAPSKTEIAHSGDVCLEYKHMSTTQCSPKNDYIEQEVNNIYSPAYNSNNVSVIPLSTPQRAYGNCTLVNEVIKDSDDETSQSSFTPDNLQCRENILNQGFDKSTQWNNHRKSQCSQSNFNTDSKQLRECPPMSNIIVESSSSLQAYSSNIWSEVDVDIRSGLAFQDFDCSHMSASQPHTSTSHLSLSSPEVIQISDAAFITQCSKTSKCLKRSDEAILKLVDQYPTPNSTNNILSPIIDIIPANVDKVKKVDASESLQFDSAYDTYNIYPLDKTTTVEGSTVEKAKRYELPVQLECKTVRRENDLNGALSKITLESSLNNCSDTRRIREGQPNVMQYKNQAKEVAVESRKMSQSLIVRFNKFMTNKRNRCVNEGIRRVENEISPKPKKRKSVNKVVEENEEVEAAQISTKCLNNTLDKLHVDDVLYKSVEIILSVFEGEEIAKTYMKRKRWKGTLEEEAINAILNLSEILEAEKKFDAYNKHIVQVIEQILTKIIDSTSLNKITLWTYHVQIILQFCDSMRICVEIINSLMMKLEAFESTLSEANYKISNRFNQLRFIFYALYIIVNKFQLVRSCDVHDRCENPIPALTDVWKRQWSDSIINDDMDVLRAKEKRWANCLESFAVKCVEDFPQFANKARRLFLLLMGK